MSSRIKDRDMYASTGFTKPEDMSDSLAEMDAQEEEIVRAERSKIEAYPQDHNGIGSFVGALTGGLTGFTLGALSANPIAPIVGAVGGGITGFKAGQYADRNCCPSILEDAGEHIYHIPEDRLNRVKDKIEALQDAQDRSDDLSPKEKRQLQRAEEHFQTIKGNATFKKVISPY